MTSREKNQKEREALYARSAQTGKYLAKEGFADLSDVVNYAIGRSKS